MFLSFILAIIQLLLIVIIVFQEYHRKSIGVFLWAMLLILFGIMHFSTVISNYHDYPMWVYNHASLFVILFCLFYMVTRKILIPSSKALCISFDDWSKDNYQFITSLQKRVCQNRICEHILFSNFAHNLHKHLLAFYNILNLINHKTSVREFNSTKQRFKIWTVEY